MEAMIRDNLEARCLVACRRTLELVSEKVAVDLQRIAESTSDCLAPIAGFNRVQPSQGADCFDEMGSEPFLLEIVHGTFQDFARVSALWASATCFLNAMLR